MKLQPPQPGTLLDSRTRSVLVAAAPEPLCCTCLLWGVFSVHPLNKLEGGRCPSQEGGEVSCLGKDPSSPSLTLSLAWLNLGV